MINWEFLTQTTLTVDDVYEQFCETFLCVFHSCFPLTQQSRKRSKDKKWITPTLKISIKHKDRLYRKKLNNPTDSNILKYKQYKNRLDVCLKRAMEVYYYEAFNKKSNSVLQMWKSLGHIFNPSRKTKSYHIDKILYENREIHDKQAVSDLKLYEIQASRACNFIKFQARLESSRPHKSLCQQSCYQRIKNSTF